MLRSDTKYFAQGSIIADSHEQAKALMVINSGLVNSFGEFFSLILGLELPMDSDEVDEVPPCVRV